MFGHDRSIEKNKITSNWLWMLNLSARWDETGLAAPTLPCKGQYQMPQLSRDFSGRCRCSCWFCCVTPNEGEPRLGCSEDLLVQPHKGHPHPRLHCRILPSLHRRPHVRCETSTSCPVPRGTCSLSAPPTCVATWGGRGLPPGAPCSATHGDPEHMECGSGSPVAWRVMSQVMMILRHLIMERRLGGKRKHARWGTADAPL